jgi:LmbE family N-acetylglucosaminyl deacetylase
MVAFKTYRRFFRGIRLMGIVFIILFVMSEKTSCQTIRKPQKCILVFGAHADDVDEIAGGTLARYTSLGYKGVYVTATNNLAGCNIERTPYFNGPRFTVSSSQLKYPADGLETNQIRSEEMKAAAAVYGATPVFLDFDEPEVYFGRKVIIYGTQDFLNYNPPGRKQINLATRYSEDVNLVVALLEKYEPEIVIIHPLGGDKLDHEGSAYMMYLAFKKAMDKGIPVGKLWMDVDGWMKDKPALATGRGRPDIQVDVKDYLRIKYEALNKHVSQNGGFGRQYVQDNGTQAKEVIEEFMTVIDNMKYPVDK